MLRRAALIGIAVGLAGCSLLYWPSKDDLSSDTAGGSSGSAISPDASSDGNASADAKTDGWVTVTCPAGALLCDDFERDTVKGAFSDVNGATSISKTQAHSPSRSLSSVVKGGAVKTGLEVTIDVKPKVDVSFWFYTATAPSEKSINVRIASLLFGDGCDWDLAWTMEVNTDVGLRMSENAYDAHVNGSCGPITFDGQTLLTQSQVFSPKWHHVTLTLDVSSATRRVTGSVDDMPAVSAQVLSQRSTVPKTMTISIGVPCTQTNSGCFEWGGDDYEVLFDDVIVTNAP